MADDPTEGELQTAAEITAARAAFLSDPPPVLDPTETTTPTVTDEAEEAAALDELTQPAEGTPVSGSESTPGPPVASTPDPYAAFGGEEQVRLAHQIQEALRTEQGVRALVANGLTALGYTPEQVKAALDAQSGAAPPAAAPASADPFAGLEDDDVVTVANVKNLVQQAAAEAAKQAIAATQPQVASVQEAVLAQQQTQVRANTDLALIEALGPVPTDPAQATAYRQQVEAIIQRGTTYYDPNQWADINHIRSVVQKAHAELEAEAETRFKAYLEGKKRARDSQPVNTSGGAGGESPPPEPKNLKEAREQAVKAGFFS